MHSTRPLSLTVALLLIGGCQTQLDAPPYSHRYQMLSGVPGQPPILVPEACLQPSVEDTDVVEAPRLAPGCANNANLLQMVERREDLLRGRATGPALAAPVGRAAQFYLQGYESEAQRLRRQEQAAQSDTGGGQ